MTVHAQYIEGSVNNLLMGLGSAFGDLAHEAAVEKVDGGWIATYQPQYGWAEELGHSGL